MKEINLTQWKVALVDDEYFEELSKYKWFAHKHRNNFYAIRNIVLEWWTRTGIKMHRIIMNIETESEVDHINWNWLDNQSSNLRICSNSENQMNRWKTISNTSGLKWVSWQKTRNKWYAQIKVNWKQKNLWRFENKEDAYNAYKKACIELHWEFAHL